MSLLSFPMEVTLQFLDKMNLVRRYHLSTAHSSLTPLCFDWTLDKNSKGSITAKELYLWYSQAKSDQERKLCFDTKILDRLRRNSCNEMIHMLISYQTDRTFCENLATKISKSLKGTMVLEGESEVFCIEFFEMFLFLLDRMEGDIFLVFLKVKSFENCDEREFRNLLTLKKRSGRKLHFISYHSIFSDKNHTAMFNSAFNCVIQAHGDDGWEEFLLAIRNVSNIVKKTKLVMDMIDGYNLLECQQQLVKLLPVLNAYKFLVPDKYDLMCPDCRAHLALHAKDDELEDFIIVNKFEPAWSNCTNCVVSDRTNVEYDKMKLAI